MDNVDVLSEGFTSSRRRTDQCLRPSRLDAETSAGESAQNHDLQAGAVMIDMICADSAHGVFLLARYDIVKQVS